MSEAAASEILSIAEMYRADAGAVAAGISGLQLMENAGAAVARIILERFIQDRGAKPLVLVLCGPGNNGGDGFVIARLLKQAKVRVKVVVLGEKSEMRGDAAKMAKRWRGRFLKIEQSFVADGGLDRILSGEAPLVVDALFGAGLSRPLDQGVEKFLRRIASLNLTSVAVDMPSGIDGDSGKIRGFALPAAMTVTFFRRKPGHLLYPGRGHCGQIIVADIGIPASVLADIAPRLAVNGPDLWLDQFPWPNIFGHKYHRGHALVVSGGLARSGAARLGARAALRVGAGLVTLIAPREAVSECAAQLTSIMLEGFATQAEFKAVLNDHRRNAVLVGPGNGVTQATRRRVLALLKTRKSLVLDADAISVFGDRPKELFRAIRSSSGPVVMTPHDGEFKRLFADCGVRLAGARKAAKRSGAVIVLKGPDTVIASPDGRAALNANAPPSLATAGSGDVLAGMVLGLMAQGMPAFEAAAAGVWLHGAAATAFGPGLIAEDLPEQLPNILTQLQNAEIKPD